MSFGTTGPNWALAPTLRLVPSVLAGQIAAFEKLPKVSKARLEAQTVDSSANSKLPNVHGRRKTGRLPNPNGGKFDGSKTSSLQEDATLSIHFTNSCTDCGVLQTPETKCLLHKHRPLRLHGLQRRH